MIVVDLIRIDSLIQLNGKRIIKVECISWINSTALLCIGKKPTFGLQYETDVDKEKFMFIMMKLSKEGLEVCFTIIFQDLFQFFKNINEEEE